MEIIVGKRIKELMETEKINQTTLALKLGVKQNMWLPLTGLGALHQNHLPVIDCPSQVANFQFSSVSS